MKKNWIVIAILMFSFMFVNVAHANEEDVTKNVELRNKVKAQTGKSIRSLYITLDKMLYALDEETVQARIDLYAKNGKTYMPISIMEKAFYSPITWNLADYSAIMMWQGNTLKISLLEDKVYYKGKEVSDIKVDVMPEGIVAVPIAEVFKILEIPYEWHSDTSSVFAYQLEEKLPKDRVIPEKKVTEKIFVDHFLKQQENQAVSNSVSNPEVTNTVVANTVVGIDNTQAYLLQLAKSRLGMPYVGGARGPYSFDCSGFVHWVLTNSGKKNYTRGSSQSLFSLCNVIRPEDLKIGDLVFFTRTYSARVPVTHSAIYIGNGDMIHAAGNRVQITPISDRYWLNHFYAYGRLK